MHHSPMSFPMIVPFPIPQNPAGAQDQVPARVRAAMGFLDALTAKQMTRPFGNDHALDTIEGMKLCPEEEATRTAALILIQRYFDGKYTLDGLEKQKGKLAYESPYPGTLLRCHVCVGAHGQPSPKCPVCRGFGQLMTFPAPEGGVASHGDH